MEVKRLQSIPDIPIQFFKPPHGMWLLGTVPDGSRYFAYRQETPSFILEVSDPHNLEIEAGKIVADFLAKMHTYGFRNT